MKKTIGILGLIVFTSVLTYKNNNVIDEKGINLNNLISLNTANAETSVSYRCYDSFVLGNTYTGVNCSGCKAQKYDQAFDTNTCP